MGKATVATLSVAVIAVTAIPPLFQHHRGSSQPVSGLMRTIKPLIISYKHDTGRWPESWHEIVSRYHPANEYSYSLHCDFHPWEQTGTRSLEGLALRLLDGAEQGSAAYEIQMPGQKHWISVSVITP